MYAEINPESLQNAFESITNLVNEAKIHVSDEGFNIKAVDGAHVAMADMTIEKNEFDVLETEERVLGVNLNNLLSQVNAIGNEIVFENDIEKTIHLEIDENNKTLKLWGSPGAMSFNLSLIDPDSIREEPDIPDINLPSQIGIDSKYFTHAIRVANGQGKHLRLETDTDNSQFHMASEGDTSSWDSTLDEDYLAIENLIAADAGGMYSLDYFNDIQKGIPSGTVMNIELGEEVPVKLSFRFPDQEIVVTYLVAPRIKND